MSHHPNPFDFVPFAEGEPTLKTPEEWLAYGNLRTGSIKVEMKTLTPVHIVGEQRMEGKNIKESLFYERHGQHYIPGSSIKGVLRGFIEAACNGWASQLTPYYPRTKKNNRHTYGFKVINNIELEKDESIDINNVCSIPEKLVIPENIQNGIDLPSFLFGFVPGKSSDNEKFNTSWKSRISIFDAEVTLPLSSIKDKNSYTIPDLKDSDAFMGGPHPSASSWWYQHPNIVKKNEQEQFTNYHFLGTGFRGRKFYFHQDPKKCIKEYNKIMEWGWLNFFPVECVEKGSSITFDIFFNNVPEQLLNIFYYALEPDKRICHKIGYGKAYGYGSIEFSILKIDYHSKGFKESITTDPAVTRELIRKKIVDSKDGDENSIYNLLDKATLDILSFILWYEEPLKHVFTYPVPGDGGFNVSLAQEKRTEHNRALKRSIENALRKYNLVFSEDRITMTEKMARDIANSLYNIKPTLHFEVYQENSEFYNEIRQKRLKLIR
ncbi:MAG: hypothetical protein HGB23_10620 [Chlorobiaceae bacterium]|nr:hypothetical protein [Chlorobiaceae bacterium]